MIAVIAHLRADSGGNKLLSPEREGSTVLLAGMLMLGVWSIDL